MTYSNQIDRHADGPANM